MEHQRLTEDEQSAFVAQVLARAADAERLVGSASTTLVIAGIPIELVFVGGAERFEMLGAFHHLVTDEPTTPQARLIVWDSAASGVHIPLPPVPRSAFTDRGDLWGMSSVHRRVAFHWLEGSLNCFDTELGLGSYWIANPSQLTPSARAAPLRSLLHWVLGSKGIQLVHAASVGTEEGAVLLTGKGGSGKSTTALLAARAGVSYLGDDYVAISDAPVPVVYSLYASAKVVPDDAARHQDLIVERLLPTGTDKAVLDVGAIGTDVLLRSAPLVAVLAPTVCDAAHSRLATIDEATLRRAASFTTLSQLPGAGQQTQDRIDAVLARVPGHELRLGRDEESTLEVIRSVLRDGGRGAQHGAPTPRPARVGPGNQLPLVSVVVPVYNGAHFLPDAVASILDQQYPSVEIIVVDDGSTDDVESVVAQLPVDVRFFRQENDGPASARNRGIRDVSADLIAFLDVDDLWPPATLPMLVAELLSRPECLVVHGHAALLYRDDVGRWVAEGNPAESFPYYIGAGLYRRAAFETVGLFDPTMWFAEDTDWYARLSETGTPAVRVPAVTLHVRRHGANMTAAKSSKELHASLLVAFKKSLDRARRRAADVASADQDPGSMLSPLWQSERLRGG